MKPIFIFSLPRSGSTLLQRSLMSHQKIMSISEPWILLPQIYCQRNTGQLSEYGSLPTSRGINDLINNLPNKQQDYNDSLKTFILDIYSKLALNNELYFLDKTPRYYKIIPEIEEIFPDAKFIFLFRSPEQVYASMLNTWSNNRLKPLSSYNDLIEGNKELSQGYVNLQEKSLAMKYEDFVLNPNTALKKITDYLEIEFDSNMTKKFNIQETKGRLGDPTGVINYNTISKDSIDKWRKTFDSRYRKKQLIKIISKIDENSLKIQGYNKDEIIKSIQSTKSKSWFKIQDIIDYNIDLLTRKFNLHHYFNEEYKWVKDKYLY